MLKRFIRLILEAEYLDTKGREIRELFVNVTKRFKQFDNNYPPYVFLMGIIDKNSDFIERFNNHERLLTNWLVENTITCERFNNINNRYTYFTLINTHAFAQYLRAGLIEHDVLIYYRDETYDRHTLRVISKETLERLLHIAETYEQFEILVKRISKAI